MLATNLNRQYGNVSHSYKKRKKYSTRNAELDCRCTASGLMPHHEALHNCDSFANPPGNGDEFDPDMIFAKTAEARSSHSVDVLAINLER